MYEIIRDCAMFAKIPNRFTKDAGEFLKSKGYSESPRALPKRWEGNPQYGRYSMIMGFTKGFK